MTAIPPVPYRSRVSGNEGLLIPAWAEWFKELYLKVLSLDKDSPFSVTASRGTPSAITAGAGITHGGRYKEIHFVEGDSGAVDITANPQISAGSRVGQTLILVGCDGTNTVKLDDGTGLDLQSSITLNDGGMIGLLWDGSNWVEMWRNL